MLVPPARHVLAAIALAVVGSCAAVLYAEFAPELVPEVYEARHGVVSQNQITYSIRKGITTISAMPK